MSISCLCRVLDSNQMPVLQQELLCHDYRQEVPAGKTQRRETLQNTSQLTWKGQRWGMSLYSGLQIMSLHLRYLLNRQYVHIEENPKSMKVKCLLWYPGNRLSPPVATTGIFPEIGSTHTSKNDSFTFECCGSILQTLCFTFFFKFNIRSLT